MGDTQKNSTVQSLTRALSLLNVLAQAPGGMTLKEVSTQAGLPPSTAHRLLTTLAESAYAHLNPLGQRWSVGVQAFSVGQSFVAGRDLIEIARAPMVKLMEETQETVKMGLLSGNQVVILTQSECSQPMRAFAEPGSRLPLYCTSLGKAFLKTMSQEAAQGLLGKELSPRTAKTPPSFDALWRELRLARKQGFAVQDEEFLVGLRGAAACIYDEAGQPVAALSVNGPTVRIPSDRLSQLGTLVAQICQQITHDYGGCQPSRVAA